MSGEQIRREWMPYRMAARQFVGISEDVLLGAMKRHELRAYKKPLTKGHTTEDPNRQRTSYFVSTEDVSEWIRTYWEPAF